jgi:hypothetical protein
MDGHVRHCHFLQKIGHKKKFVCKLFSGAGCMLIEIYYLSAQILSKYMYKSGLIRGIFDNIEIVTSSKANLLFYCFIKVSFIGIGVDERCCCNDG